MVEVLASQLSVVNGMLSPRCLDMSDILSRCQRKLDDNCGLIQQLQYSLEVARLSKEEANWARAEAMEEREAMHRERDIAKASEQSLREEMEVAIRRAVEKAMTHFKNSSSFQEAMEEEVGLQYLKGFLEAKKKAKVL